MTVDWISQYIDHGVGGQAGKTYGMGALNRLRGEGFTDAVLNAANRKLGYTLNKKAQAAMSDDAGNWLTPEFGNRGGFGIEQYELMKARGHTGDEIRQALPASGLKRGGNLDAYMQDEINRGKWKLEEKEATLADVILGSGKDYSTTGASAQNMKINKGSKFGSSKHGTKGTFGRRGKFTGSTPTKSTLNIGSKGGLN